MEFLAVCFRDHAPNFLKNLRQRLKRKYITVKITGHPRPNIQSTCGCNSENGSQRIIIIATGTTIDSGTAKYLKSPHMVRTTEGVLIIPPHS
jgi:glutamate racemase